jgi:RimJ/RimL family protein N-acetyltransferase
MPIPPGTFRARSALAARLAEPQAIYQGTMSRTWLRGWLRSHWPGRPYQSPTCRASRGTNAASTPSPAIGHTGGMKRETIPAGWLMLRPFTPADIPWVYEVSLDPALQHFVQVPSPYQIEHAEFFVHQLGIASWDSGQRAEFLAQDTATGTPLGRVGLDLREPGAAEIGYWVDPRARGRGVATAAVRATCQWAFTTLNIELIEWRCEVGNTASRRVAEKAGFLAEATLRKRLTHRGTRVDAWVGSLLSSEANTLPG